MSKIFDFDAISTIEFGVCIDAEKGEQYFLIPANNNVKLALKEMLSATAESFLDSGKLEADIYEASEKYGSTERLKLSLNDEMNKKLKELYDATNIATNPDCLSDPNLLVYYFALFHDKNKNKLLAVRRAQYFRGIAKPGNVLVRMWNEALDLVEDDVFKLDKVFDYFICDNTVYVLRPSGFEFTAGIETYILERGAENALDLGKTISFLDTSNLSEFVKTHKRAARLLASIRIRSDLNKTSLNKFKKACKANGIELVTSKGTIAPAEGHEMGFLQMLDRRRYTLSLTDDGDELYEATGRKNVK